jgi:hypothetical protein
MPAVKAAINNCSETYSSGPNGFSAFLLRRLKNSFSLPSSIIFNLSYESGCIPEIWKHAIGVLYINALDHACVLRIIDLSASEVFAVKLWNL